MNIYKPPVERPRSTTPGLVHMTDREYRQQEGTNHSLLFMAYINPEEANLYVTGQRQHTSDAMELGTMLHTALLRPDEYDDLYYMIDDQLIVQEIGGAKPRATNKYKEWMANQELIAAGRNIVTMDEVSRINAMVMNIYEAFPWLWSSPSECVVQWTDPLIGMCKAMIDLPMAYCPLDGNTYCVDIKTVGLDPRNRPYIPMQEPLTAMLSSGHLTQAAFYSEGLATVTPELIINANLYVLKEFPYTPYLVIHRTDDAIHQADVYLDALKQNFNVCFPDGKYRMQPLVFQV